MSMITRYEFPLIKVVDSKGTFLAKNEMSSKEEVTLRLYDDEGKIGVIKAISLKNSTVKVFCYSRSEEYDLNIMTAYMGFPFNGPIDVRKKDSDEPDNYKFWHLWEVRKETGCGYRKLKEEAREKSIAAVVNTLVEFHNLHMLDLYNLKKMNLKDLADMYHNLVDSAKKFSYE
jgi:hypothetical protein